MRKILVIKRKGKLKMKSRNILQLQYKSKGKQLVKEYPIRDLEAILVIGNNIYIESGVFSVLPSYNIPVAIVAKDAIGIQFNPIIVVNPHYRKLQYTLNKVKALEIALEYIKSRIYGMRNILKYYKVPIPNIPELPESTNNPQEFEQRIRIWESVASNDLWPGLISIIKQDYLNILRKEYGFAGRKPRHPDPFNKTLSVMYAVLYSLATKALIAAGLDPTFGFLHRTRYSTPLTFDYTEMFKPVAIEATIALINSEGLPELDVDGELKREWINKTIRQLYNYLTLIHKDIGKTIYQQIYLKAFCLAKYLEGRCRRDRLTVTWNRALYRQRKRSALHP